MLTYELSKEQGSLYESLYKFIKKDIQERRIKAGEKLPSKRALADNLGVSTITVENAYNQLIDEGYMYSLPKKGYFVADISEFIPRKSGKAQELSINLPKDEKAYKYDFSSNQNDSGTFPFATWTKMMREVISMNERELLKVSPPGGLRKLREAIASHLSSFRGMSIDPDQIIVGAGTEYLYTMLIKLLGSEKIYAIENPGYEKIKRIYDSNGVESRYIKLDEAGMNLEELQKSGAHIAHVSPTHHFPTGITMPLIRRKGLLGWANEENGRYIIEDEYDSEFRLNGRPVPPLMTMDSSEKVVYMNTFSKSLTSTIRISYMVLPRHLANEFYEKLSFYSNTVSTFDQATLAEFISRGYFEKHINRMRLYYSRKRKQVLDILNRTFGDNECEINEQDSGLHFIIRLATDYSDKEVEKVLEEKGIRIVAVTDFDRKGAEDSHSFILNYSAINLEGLEAALKIVMETVIRR